MNDEIDFRDRYHLPEHFVLDKDSKVGMKYLQRTEDIIKHIPKNKKEILDLGCGDGYFSNKLIQQGFKVTGLDYNKQGIRYAKAFNPKGKFIHGDIRTYKFRKKFDAITFIATLEHIAPQYHNQIIKNIYNTLKKGGKLIITIPTKYKKKQKYHYIHFSKEDITYSLKKHQFKINKYLYHNEMNFLIKLIYNNKIFFILNNTLYDLKFIRKIMGIIYRLRFSRTTHNKKYNLLTIIAQK